jgi:DNA polymerase-1
MKLPPESREKTLYLVDISSFIFRAFYAIRHMSTKDKEPTNAVYGVAAMLGKLIQDAAPKYLTVVYDSKEASFRRDIYPEYKANRSAPPEELVPQFDRIEELIAKMGLHSVRVEGVEADDLIGTLTHRWLAEDPKHEVMIVTGDKDLMQLVTDRSRAWDTMKDVIYGPKEVEEKFGVKPDQVRDYLALVGDSSDNIPGVPSIGPKGAVDLLKEWGNLEGVLAAAKAGKIKGKKGETIAANEKDAFLSQQLASLVDVEKVKADLHGMRVPFDEGQICVTPECLALLEALEFRVLRDKWSGGAAPAARKPTGEPSAGTLREAPESEPAVPEAGPSPAAVSSGITLRAGSDTFACVQTEAAFIELMKKLEKAPEFGFDLETTSLNPREAKLVGIALAPDAARGYYLPVGHRRAPTLENSALPPLEQLPLEYVLSKLRPILEDPKRKKVGHNLKYDFSVLSEMGLRPDGIGADTMVADYVLDPEGRHNLDTVAGKWLGYSMTTYEMVCGKGKDQICFDEVPIDVACRYSAEDAWVAMNLWKVMKPRIQAEGLMRIFAEVDMPLVQVIGEMERAGVSIDEPWLRSLSEDFKKELAAIDLAIQKYTRGPVNLNSPKQLAELLFTELKLPPQGKTKTGYSTDASVLQALAGLHEVPKLILQHREISKLLGTYVDPLPSLRDAKTGKIHASFHQTVAATGRLSSSDPNLQNIPARTERGQKIRRAFIPSAGNVLVAADYSQIELRILAEMSGDADLVGSFTRNEDVHRRTASDMFSVPPAEVTDKQRGIAKAINFGLMYGKSAFGLAEELSISRTEAKDMIARYFQRYHGVKTFLDGLIENAKATGETTTMLGRKRALREINSKNPAVRAGAERMAMNTPIQGTAADMMKLAMIRLADGLKAEGLRSKLIIQVHDEVVLDVPRDELAAVKKLVVRAMEGAFDGVVEFKVPLKVNVEVGENWSEMG